MGAVPLASSELTAHQARIRCCPVLEALSMKAEGIIETVRTTEGERAIEAVGIVGVVRKVEIARFVRAGCKLALAIILFTGLCTNSTSGSRWMVQVQPGFASSAVQTQTQTDAQNKNEQPRTVRRASPIDTIRRSLQRLGYAVDEAKSQPGMVVSTYSDAKKGKVTIVMIYDKRKEVVGFYIYKFGNVDKAVDPVALNKYLLAANDEIIIGGFFVDKEGDIGYKYVSSASQLSLASFEVVYVTMATVALDRRPQIRQLIETGKKEEGAAR